MYKAHDSIAIDPRPWAVPLKNKFKVAKAALRCHTDLMSEVIRSKYLLE